MRPYILLIFTAVILAFFSGRYLLKFQGPMTASSSDVIEISKIKLAFQKNITPYAIVNFSSLYYSKEHLQTIVAISFGIPPILLFLNPMTKSL